MMENRSSTLTPMALARYYMSRIARYVEDEQFQALCRTVAYAIHPAHTAYQIALRYGVTDLPTPEEIFGQGEMPG